MKRQSAVTGNDCPTRLLGLQPSVGNRSGSGDNGLNSTNNRGGVPHRDMVEEPLTLPLLRIEALAGLPGRQPEERIFHCLGVGESFDSWLGVSSFAGYPIPGQRHAEFADKL